MFLHLVGTNARRQWNDSDMYFSELLREVYMYILIINATLITLYGHMYDIENKLSFCRQPQDRYDPNHINIYYCKYVLDTKQCTKRCSSIGAGTRYSSNEHDDSTSCPQCVFKVYRST